MIKKLSTIVKSIITIAILFSFILYNFSKALEDVNRSTEGSNNVGSSVIINNGVTTTDTREVALKISSKTASEMIISNSEYYINKPYQLIRGNVKLTIPPEFKVAVLDANGVVNGYRKILEWEDITESEINKGIVLVDKNDNEFVWIPVDEVVEGTTVDTTLSTNKVILSRYGWNDGSEGTVSSSSGKSNFYESTSNVVSSNGVGKNEYQEMQKSVKTYGGFYIGRYEASFGGIKGSNMYNIQSKPSTIISISSTFVKDNSNKGRLWNYISQAGASIYASSMYKQNEYLNSHLPYGAEYDAILKWLIKTGNKTLSQIQTNSTSWGNNSGTLINSGSNLSYQANHICDLAGNLSEYTQELGTTQTGNKSVVTRGGSYENTNPVSFRKGTWNLTGDPVVKVTSSSYGFRVSAYIRNEQGEPVNSATIWENVKETINWKLDEELGDKTVVIYFKDGTQIEEAVKVNVELISIEKVEIENVEGHITNQNVMLDLYSSTANGMVISESQIAINDTISITRGSTTITIPPNFSIAELGEDGSVIGKKPLAEWRNITEEEINAGIVVVDDDGNEFVWIPVDSVPNDLTVSNQIVETESSSINEVTFARVNWSAQRVGYTTDAPLKTTNSTRTKGVSDEATEAEYNEMLNSVRNYHGFYVGRYEATPGADTSVATTKRGLEPLTSLKRPAMLTAAENLYGSSSIVSSHQMYSVEWDTMLKWLMKTQVVTLNEINNSGFGNSATGSILNKTGTVYTNASGKTNVTNQIYDIEGNCWERVQSRGSVKVVFTWGTYWLSRGGNFKINEDGSTYAAGSYATYFNTGHDTVYTSDDLGMRIAVNIRTSVGTPTSIDDILPYTTAQNFSLSSGYGTKTVYVYYFDADRNITTVQDSVEYVSSYMTVVPSEAMIDLSVTTTEQLYVDGLGYGDVTFSSSDVSIATVDENGLVTAIKNGNVIITVRGSNDNLSDDCSIIVQTSPSSIILSAERTTVTSEVGTQLNIEYSPTDSNVNKEITWLVSKEDVIIIQPDGTVRAGSIPGTVQVTAVTKNGVTATINITYDGSMPIVMEWTIPVDADGTVGAGTTIKLPIPTNTENNYTVSWGDGNANSYTVEEFPTHIYTNSVKTIYKITITGKINKFGYNANVQPTTTNTYKDYYTFSQYLTRLKQWGELDATRYGFSYCTNLSGTIPEPTGSTFKNIIDFNDLFFNCSSLTGSISETLFLNSTSTFERAFYGCSNLTSANVNIAYCGAQMFYACNKLTDIIIGNNVQVIGTNAFYATSPYSNTNFLVTNLETENAIALEYDWIGDNRDDGRNVITAEVSLNPMTYIYDGTEKEPSILVNMGGTALVQGTDYIVAYSNNVNVGTATAMITGINNYTGTASKTFTITNATLSVTATDYKGTYDGVAHGITLSGSGVTGATITYGTTAGGYTLTEAPKYTNAGEYTVYFQVEKENYDTYTGSAKVTINKKSVTVVWSNTSLTYNATSQKPTATAASGVTGETINLTVSGAQINVGDYTATASIASITGGQAIVSNYTVTNTSTEFSILVDTGVTFDVTLDNNTFTYDGTMHTPGVTVKVGDKTLVEGTDYTVAYTNNKNAGTGTVTIIGIGNYAGIETTENFTITGKDISTMATVTLTPSTYAYDGNAKEPTVTMIVDGEELVIGTDYTVTYSNNVNVGTATATITGKGNYIGTKDVTFTIKEINLSISAVNYVGTYDGKSHGITINGDDLSEATIRYGTSLGNYNLSESPKYIDVGEYTIYFRVEKDGYSTYTGSTTVLIEPKSISFSIEDNVIYNGKIQKPIVTVDSGVEGETINVSVTVNGEVINAGSYKANIKIESVTGGQGKITNYIIEQ